MLGHLERKKRKNFRALGINKQQVIFQGLNAKLEKNILESAGSPLNIPSSIIEQFQILKNKIPNLIQV